MKLITALFFLALLSCVSYPREIKTTEIDFGYDLPLIKDSSWGSFSALQELTIERDGKEFSFKVQVEVYDNQITVIGLTPVHSRSFLISYENGKVNYEEHPFFKYPLSPEQMIADIQMTWISYEKWHKQLKGSEISVGYNPKTQTTVFKTGSKELVEVTKAGRDAVITHHGFECKIKIKTLDFEKL